MELEISELKNKSHIAFIKSVLRYNYKSHTNKNFMKSFLRVISLM